LGPPKSILGGNWGLFIVASVSHSPARNKKTTTALPIIVPIPIK